MRTIRVHRRTEQPAFYSYDPHGNVDTLLQDYGTSGVMYSANNRFKLMALIMT